MPKLSKPALEPILNGSVTPDEAVEEARYRLSCPDPDFRWCIPWAYVLWSRGRYEESYNILSEHHSSLENDSDFLLLFGMVARQLPGHQIEAEAAFKAAIFLDPQRHDAFYNLGNFYYAQDRFDEAIEQYNKCLRINPYSKMAWLNLGLASRSSDQLLLSKESLQHCLKLDPQSIRAWCNFGITCHQLEKFDQAIRCYKHALSLDEDHGPTLVNLAQSLNASNRHPEAVKYLQAASSLTLQEDAGDALFNLALTRLLLGDYKQGWELYECRFKTRQHDEVFTKIPAGEWIQDSKRLKELAELGSEMVIWSEQGLGDSIQFVRYLHLLSAIGVRPILATRPLLVRLFREWLEPSFQVVDDVSVDIKEDKRPHTSLLSLPHLFSTELYSVPSVIPYLFPKGPPPRPLLVGEPPGGLSVGLVWASNPDNKLMYRRKSLSLPDLLEPLLPALREDLLQLHCLQVGDDANALEAYREHPNIIDWNGRLGDFADTAHVIRQLDLVISVDTGVAHLAGALGVPVWLMLHYDADFRWLRNVETSPWYPGMRLFRQKIYGDWSTVIHPLFDELGRIYGLDLLALR